MNVRTNKERSMENEVKDGEFVIEEAVERGGNDTADVDISTLMPQEVS